MKVVSTDLCSTEYRSVVLFVDPSRVASSGFADRFAVILAFLRVDLVLCFLTIITVPVLTKAVRLTLQYTVYITSRFFRECVECRTYDRRVGSWMSAYMTDCL